ncbi:MAG: S-layer homology domain-containing protein [Acidobacteriota bacterium]
MSGIRALMLMVTFAGGGLIAVPGFAQIARVVPAPEMVPVAPVVATAETPHAYGLAATTVAKIHGTAFRSQCSGDSLDAFWDTGITYRSAGNVNCMLHAPVQLPAGALVTQVGFDGYDVDPALNISWGIYYVSQSSADTTGYFAWYASSQSGGSFNATATLGSPYTVDAGNYYFALVELPKLGQDLRIKGMRVVYKLQVSPAPATATFNDVPVGAFGFQFIEALAASGITAGCGGGNFCPNDPITRAQMAVFLSAALGLHWPG